MAPPPLHKKDALTFYGNRIFRSIISKSTTDSSAVPLTDIFSSGFFFKFIMT